MSTGESDYAKRVVELSMQLANSRADVENLRMRIKAVDKEHEQLKKDRADMVDRFDAALRRAKVEGVRLAVQEHRCWEDVLRTEYRNVPTFEAWIDARAAQIEEGE
jgi:predicted  nucleic acid-binding Zn-ribbon protein